MLGARQKENTALAEWFGRKLATTAFFSGFRVAERADSYSCCGKSVFWNSSAREAAMPVVRPPDGGPAIKLPRCPDCGKAMRLESSDPNTHYANLDQLKFVCGSGQTTEKIIAH
jgi:hypothetical protein